jgi:hypothetical protein
MVLSSEHSYNSIQDKAPYGSTHHTVEIKGLVGLISRRDGLIIGLSTGAPDSNVVRPSAPPARSMFFLLSIFFFAAFSLLFSLLLAAVLSL